MADWNKKIRKRDKEPTISELEMHNLQENQDVEGLIKALDYKDDYEIRSKAAKALGDIGDKKAVEPLIQALRDEYFHVRLEAVKALAKIADERTIKAFISVFENEKEVSWVLDSAIEALVKIGKPTVEPLIKALKHKSWSVRWGAVETLGKIKDRGAVDSLIKALKDRKECVRYKAAEALGEMGDVKAYKPLS